MIKAIVISEPVLRLSDQQVRHVFIEIMSGRGNHGGFLRSLAEAVVRADPSNLELVRPTALAVIDKYELSKYLDNYRPWPPVRATGTEST